MAHEYPDLLVWVDLETTGLDPVTDYILELGLLLTDTSLNKLESRSWVVNQSPPILGGMSEWCLRQHGRSGLLADSAVSKLTMDQLRAQSLGWLMGLPFTSGKRGKVPMCGASVHFDRAFLRRWAKDLEAWFYYGNLDVSSIQKLARYWYPDLPAWTDTEVHRVDPDNEDAVAELRYYREHIFQVPALVIPERPL